MQPFRRSLLRHLVAAAILAAWTASGVEATLPDPCPRGELAAAAQCSIDRPDADQTPGADLSHRACHCEHSHLVGLLSPIQAGASVVTAPSPARTAFPSFRSVVLVPPVPPPLS